MATAPVVTSVSGTGFAVNVTAANLSTDLTLKDFVVLIGSPAAVNNNSNWTKTSPTILTYIGASLPAATPLEIRRKTPETPIQYIQYAQRFSSGDWNNELDRITRRAEEYALYGVGPGSVLTVATPLDTPFGVAWNGNVNNPPTLNSVYDYVSGLAPLASPSLTGTPTAPTAVLSTNNTQIATTGFVQGNLASYAPLASPTLSGTPAAPTAVNTTNTTQLATTAFVHLASAVKRIFYFTDTTVRSATAAWALAVGSTSITPLNSNSKFLIIGLLVSNSGTTAVVLPRLRVNNTTTIAAEAAYANLTDSTFSFMQQQLHHNYAPGSVTPFTIQLEGRGHNGSACDINIASVALVGETMTGTSKLIIIEYNNSL